MKQDKRHSLIRVALALALAGYCVAPVALAEDSAWANSDETSIFQGTIPWLCSEGGSTTTDTNRVTLTFDLKGARPQGSETDRHLYSDDKLTVSWEAGDTGGGVDLGGLGSNAKTIGTVRWIGYKDTQGGDPRELAAKVTSYTLTGADHGRCIGIEITPTAQTDAPSVETTPHLYGVSTASSDGNGSNDITPGPVVNQSLRVAIFVNGTSINLINGNTPIGLGETYVVKLYSGESKSGKFDAGTDTDATVNYDLRWVLSGSSQQLGTLGGIANSSFDDSNLVIPATNNEARTNLDGPTCDGKGAFSIPTSGDKIQGYKLHIIYKHR